MATNLQPVMNAFMRQTRGHRYISGAMLAPTTDEIIVHAVDYDGGNGRAERRVDAASVCYAADPVQLLVDAFLKCCAEIDARRRRTQQPAFETAMDEFDAAIEATRQEQQRRAHADTEPLPAAQRSIIAKTFQEAAAEIRAAVAPPASPHPAVAMYRRAHTLTLSVDPACPQGVVYLVDKASGNATRLTNTGGAGGGQQVTVRADPTIPPGGMRVHYTQPIVQGTFRLDDAPTPQTATKPPTDPLSIELDGVALCKLLDLDELSRREQGYRAIFTPAQRSAISAHWSAQLRAKVEAAKAKEREQVAREMDDDGE